MATRYMFLLYGDESGMADVTPEQWEQMIQAHNAWGESVHAAGATIVAQEKAEPYLRALHSAAAPAHIVAFAREYMLRLGGVEARVMHLGRAQTDDATVVLFPDGQLLSELWRTKQLEYTWQRSLMRRHADFNQVTRDALRHVCAAMRLPFTDAALEQLMAAYRHLAAFPDALNAVSALHCQIKLAILSNGAPDMLNAVVATRGWNRPVVMAGLVLIDCAVARAPQAKPMLPVPMCVALVCATPVVMVKHMIAVAADVEAGEKVMAGTAFMPAPLIGTVMAVMPPDPVRVELTVSTAPDPVVSCGWFWTVTVGAVV